MARGGEPLFAGLEPYDAWFTALRRDQSPTRANLQPVEPFKLPGGKTIQKISPLADWTTRDVYQYMQAHKIPELSLYDLTKGRINYRHKDERASMGAPRPSFHRR